jgi:nucleotide-binding universal stress UspA family protein
MFDNVIAGIGEYEAGRDTLALVAELAHDPRRLTLAYVEVVTLKPDPDSRPAWQQEERRGALERLASLRDEFCADAEALCVEAGSVAQGLRTLAVDSDADLVVVGASRRDEYERQFVGDDVRDLVKNPPCAVAVAPVGHSTAAAGLSTVGVAYDGSAASERALAVGRELAEELGAGLSAFQAVPVPIRVHDPWNADRELAQGVEAARASIAQLGDVEAHAAAGEAAETLARFGASVDLLVVGPHDHQLIDDLMSGSTAQRLAASPTCPLLVLASRT